MEKEAGTLESESDFLARLQKSEWRYHPRSGLSVYGEIIKPGDTIQPDDLYDSTNGKWEKAPCSGVRLGEGTSAVWVRPLHKNPSFG